MTGYRKTVFVTKMFSCGIFTATCVGAEANGRLLIEETVPTVAGASIETTPCERDGVLAQYHDTRLDAKQFLLRRSAARINSAARDLALARAEYSESTALPEAESA